MITETEARSDTVAERSLAGRTVLVTGAGNGIGSGIVTAMAEAGAMVVANDADADAAQHVAEGLTTEGVPTLAAPGDITRQETIDSLAQVCCRNGGIDVLVNNAGVTGRQHLEDLDLDTWNRVLQVNLTAPFALASAVIPQMKHQHYGRIINVSSIAGHRVSVLGGAAYTASKAGILGLTRHLAMELAVHNITVNSILPGVTMTSLVEQATDAATRERVAASVPLGRMALPGDIGSLAVYLAGEGSSFITGVSIPVDGGMTVLPGDFTEYRSTRREP